MKYFLLFLLVFIGAERFCHKQTKGFTLQKIASRHDFTSPEKENPEIEKILDQTYSYLGHGGQSYVFLSSDGTHVLKFFKQHHIRHWNIINSLPFKPQKFLAKHHHQSPEFYESCRIAFNDFKDLSGLVYLHLNKTQIFKKKLTLIDNLNISHQIDMDNLDFAIQKRAVPAHQKFEKLISENNITDAKKCIDSLFNLIEERSKRGIADRDPNIRKNIGFIGLQAIEMDLGSFSKGENGKDPFAHTIKFKKWLESKNKELALYFDER